MTEILLIAGGGHCRSVIDVIEQGCRFEIEGIVDRPELLDSNFLGYSVIGNGVVIMPNAIVNASASIGDICIINSKALIEHDCLISKHCHISTNATINGGVRVESGCFVGSGATTRELITISENSFIKAGSLVV
jgi:acetyltransferase-like isoleucine patch superfamily enzyme